MSRHSWWLGGSLSGFGISQKRLFLMSTAALGSAGAGEPPHLPDRTTNTPTTWRLYSPLCCSRAAAAAAQPPPAPAAGQGWPDRWPVKPIPSCSPLQCPARPSGTEGLPLQQEAAVDTQAPLGSDPLLSRPPSQHPLHSLCVHVFVTTSFYGFFFPIEVLWRIVKNFQTCSCSWNLRNDRSKSIKWKSV